MKLMKAIKIEAFGSPKVLKIQDMAVPPLSNTEVLIKMKTAGLNPVDTYIREGAFLNLPELPFIPGKDGAGIIENVGSNTHYQKGQRVFLCQRDVTQFGTCAEYAIAKQENVFPLADHLSFDEGAAIGIPYFTAFRALILKGKAAANDHVLVHGASGAVGLAAVQIAKAHKMTVIGTAGTKEGLEIVKKCGADYVFCHKEKNYINEINELVQEKKIDVIIEMLSNVNLNKDLQLLARNGRVMVVGCRGCISINPRYMMGPETQIIGVALLNSTDEEWKITSEAILKGIKDGWVKPIIDKKYSLDEIQQAHHDIIHSKGAKGKLVISIEP